MEGERETFKTVHAPQPPFYVFQTPPSGDPDHRFFDPMWGWNM
jgi:hypothetical protein